MSGRLYIIATPIGNLGDLTQRANEALGESALVFAEDTRVTVKLLNHLGLKKRLLSCHNFNESSRLPLLSNLAKEDKTVALVCDAGMPLVSDPGFQIVQKAIVLGMQTIPIPGPSAFLLALVGSGLPPNRFVFEGFLPERKRDRQARLAELSTEQRTLIFYIAPHDALALLLELSETFKERSACLARELTKIHEEFVRGTLLQLREIVRTREVLGECVLVVEGAPAAKHERASKEVVLKELSASLSSGQRLKTAAATIGKRFSWPKSEVYKLGLEYQKKSADHDDVMEY